MAKKKKIELSLEKQQRVTPGSFNKLNDNLNNIRNQEAKNEAQEDIQENLENLENKENQDNQEGLDDLENSGDLENLDKEEADDEESDSEESDESNDNDKLENSEDKETDENNQDNESEDRKMLGERGQSSNSDNEKSPDVSQGETQNVELPSDDEEDESFNFPNETLNKTNEIVQGFNKVALRIKNFFLTFLRIVLNPLFWVVILILILMAYVTSVMTVVGQNDYNILCDDMGVGSLMLAPDADPLTRQSAIVSWLTSTPFEIMNGQPLTKEQAIGIMGNMIIESYGANPRAIQNDHSITKWQTCDNNCVLSWGDVGGKAIGIIQWDTGRRIEMVKFAISEGTEWHDLSTQLKFLKKEMDNGYERGQLESGGFHEPAKSIDEYVKIFNQKFERSRDSYAGGNNPRQVAANTFATSYSGSGANVGGGLANYCIGGMGGVDTTNLIQLAIASAWPDREDSRGVCNNPGYVSCGQTYAMAAYKEIKILAENNSSKDPIPGLLASCDRYVATMYRASGKDINMPWGSSGTQAAYMKSSPKWAQISCQDRQPGDVLWREGHVMLYIGDVNGKDSIGSASLSNRTGAIGGVSCSGHLFIADGDTATGFRKVVE